MEKDLAKELEKVEALANASKMGRLMHNPFKYAYAILLKNAFYPIFHKESLVRCTLFTGDKVKVILPSSTDIYLTGGKSHNSEIRLARFLIHNLKDQDCFWDIGAHYGYFSVLASELVGSKGKVFSVEASPTTFKVLTENAGNRNNVSLYQNAVSDNCGKMAFFELPNLYSEYNTINPAQYETESWFARVKPQKVEVEAITLDALFDINKTLPKIIKIDVEGGEFAVIKGGGMLQPRAAAPIIVMEYLKPERHNQPHKLATQTLLDWGFKSHVILNDGSISLVKDIEQHLLKNGLESDNIVFKK